MNPVLALIITNIIWGAASPIFKLALENIPPFTLAFLRFFVASFVFLFVALRHWQKMTLRELGIIFLGGLFGITINIGFFFMGIEKTESINAPIIGSAQPLFIYIFAILFLRERPHKRLFFGMMLAFLGILVIVLSPLFMDHGITATARKTALEGNLYLIIATFGAVMETILLKKVLKKINHYQVTYLVFFLSSLLFLPLLPGELSRWSFASLDWRGLSGLLFGIFLSSALAYSLYHYGLSKIDAQDSGIFAYIDPVSAVLLAAPLVHEHPTVFFYAGTLLVFVGIFLAEGRVHWHPFHRLKLQKKTTII